MADEAALALQPGGSPSVVAAEREAPSPPAGEPLRKRPRRDGPGLGRGPGEPGGTAPERELPAAAGGCPAAAAALWREAQAAAAAGEGDNGPGLQGLSREAPPADDFYDDDDEGEEEEEAAAAIGYRGAQGAGGRDCASPLLLPGPLLSGGGVSGGLRARAWLCAFPLPTWAFSRAPAGLRAGLPERPADSLPPLLCATPTFLPAARPRGLAFCAAAGRATLAVGFKISFCPLLLL